MKELAAGVFAEIAHGTNDRLAYERETLAVLDRSIGCDVGFFVHEDGASSESLGLDERVRREVAPRWDTFRAEYAPVRERAFQEGNVAVDVECLGVRRLERLELYQSLMRPHRGRSTATVCLRIDGRMLGGIALGRCTPGFTDGELAALRSCVATLTLCELRFLRAPQEPTGAAARAAVAALTPSERQVVDLLGRGYSNEQIAIALGKAPRTVRNQLSSAYEKLGVATRAEAVAVLARVVW